MLRSATAGGGWRLALLAAPLFTSCSSPSDSGVVEASSATHPTWTPEGHSSAAIHVVYEPFVGTDAEFNYVLFDTDPNTGSVNEDTVSILTDVYGYEPETLVLEASHRGCPDEFSDDVQLEDRPAELLFRAVLDDPGTPGGFASWELDAAECSAEQVHCLSGDAGTGLGEATIAAISTESGMGTFEGALPCVETHYDAEVGIIRIDGTFEIVE